MPPIFPCFKISSGLNMNVPLGMGGQVEQGIMNVEVNIPSKF
jgi:hypothetical protein